MKPFEVPIVQIPNGAVKHGGPAGVYFECHLSSCCGKRIFGNLCMACGGRPAKAFGPQEDREFEDLVKTIKAKNIHGVMHELRAVTGEHDFWNASSRGNKQFLNI